MAASFVQIVLQANTKMEAALEMARQITPVFPVRLAREVIRLELAVAPQTMVANSARLAKLVSTKVAPAVVRQTMSARIAAFVQQVNTRAAFAMAHQTTHARPV